MADKYLKLGITAGDGFKCEAWKAFKIEIKPMEGTMKLVLHGYKAGTAIRDGKEPKDSVSYEIPDITVLNNFNAIYTELAGILINADDSPLKDSVLTDVPT